MEEVIYVVSLNYVHDYENILVTTDLERAINKNIESNHSEITVWIDGVEIETYGNSVHHNQTTYKIIHDRVLEIVNNYLNKI
ncbi:hypothetical protein [Paenibacillus pini]|uniref:hypothetical protein n=1 Tax=Paenibacillus pini TaxID=669461 RepID=UPI00055CAF10|nr:hypothetical protein [Paenibacillus pini]